MLYSLAWQWNGCSVQAVVLFQVSHIVRPRSTSYVTGSGKKSCYYRYTTSHATVFVWCIDRLRKKSKTFTIIKKTKLCLSHLVCMDSTALGVFECGFFPFCMSFVFRNSAWVIHVWFHLFAVFINCLHGEKNEKEKEREEERKSESERVRPYGVNCVP